MVKVFIVSDIMSSFNAQLKLELTDFMGNIIWSKDLLVDIPAISSRMFFQAAKSDVLKGVSAKNVLLKAVLLQNGKLLSNNLLYFALIKNLNLPAPKITKTIAPISGGYRIILSTDTLAKNVYLGFDELDGFFSNNFFDLLPGETVEIVFKCKEKIIDIADKIKLLTIQGTY
jgi:beta-mannosidase